MNPNTTLERYAIVSAYIHNQTDEAWETMLGQIAAIERPQFTREQIAFIAEKILAAAFDRIEASLPDTIPLAEFLQHQVVHLSNIAVIRDTGAMGLAILFAQTTGEGMGCYDWAGSMEYHKAVDDYIAERTNPKWPGLKPGDKCHPDPKPFAEAFADEWAEAVGK